jgi:hypothetical protein
MEPVLTKSFGDKVVKVFYDEDANSPRGDDNLGEILYSKKSRYTLGDQAVDLKEIDKKLKDPNFICVPVFAYIHGDVRLSTKPFSCLWDSGQSGIICVSKDKIKNWFGVKRVGARIVENVIGQLHAEVATYSRYLSGQVFGYVVEDDKGEEVDSCWGYFEEPLKIVDLVQKELGV